MSRSKTRSETKKKVNKEVEPVWQVPYISTALEDEQKKRAIFAHPNYPRLDENYRAVVEGKAVVKNLYTTYPPNVAYSCVLNWVYQELYHYPDEPLHEIKVTYKDKKAYDNLFL